MIFAVTVAPGAACGAHTETPRSADCPTFSKSKVVPLTRSWSTPPTNPAAPLPWLTPTAFTTASGNAAFTCANVAVKPRSPNRLGMPGRPTAPLTDQPPPAVDGVHRCHWYGATRTPLFLGSHVSVAKPPRTRLDLIGMLMPGAAWSLPNAGRSTNVSKARSPTSARRVPPNRWANTVARSAGPRVVRRR